MVGNREGTDMIRIFIFNLIIKAISFYLLFVSLVALITVAECAITDKDFCKSDVNILGISIEVSK